MFEFLRNLFSSNEDNQNEPSLDHSLNSHNDSIQVEVEVVEELKKIGAPFVANLTRRDSIAGIHTDIQSTIVEPPEDHVSYQKHAKDRIKEKVTGWKNKGELSQEELESIEKMLEDGEMTFGVLDTEEFVDSIRNYLAYKEKHGAYSEEEKKVHTVANDFSNLLLDRESLYKTEVGTVLQKLKALADEIKKVKDPQSLRWAGVLSKVEALHEKIDKNKKVLVEDALEMQGLIASWPPSLDNRLLEHKSRVNTKVLARPNEMDLFDMSLDDLVLRDASQNELNALNKAVVKSHSVLNQTIILRPEDVNKTIRDFREYHHKLDSPEKKQAHLKYGKDVDEFVTLLNKLKSDNKDGSSDKFKRQVSSSNFQEAATKLKLALEAQNPQLEGIDKLIAALKDIIGDFKDKGGTKKAETAYKALIKALNEAPTTLSPNVLVLQQAQEQSKHSKDSTWYRNDLFKTSKGLAEGFAYIFEELNEYHKYINQLNNFVLSLITVENGESKEALESRSNIIKNLSIEAITGSVNYIINWQSQGKTTNAIESLRSAMKKIGGSDVPGALTTTMDALSQFKTAFDPIAGRNFTKSSVTINGQKVSSADRNKEFDNPLNPSNEKTANKGIAIMKGSVDTIMALKKVVQEFTKPPSTDTLSKTIDLCDKWNTAILNLNFEKDVKSLTKNIDILAKFPETSTPPPKKEQKELTIEELEKTGGFSLPTFKNTIKQRLLEYIEQRFKEKTKDLKNVYALRFAELLKYIDKDLVTPEEIDPDYETRKLTVNYVDNMMGKIEDSDYVEILNPFKERYRKRIDNEINWRELSKGKASKIEDADGFKKKTPITTHKDAKKQGPAQIDYHLEKISALEEEISKSTKDMDLQIFLPNVNIVQFETFSTAKPEALAEHKRKYPDTFQNLIEESDTAALPTVLRAMRTTGKVADGIDMMSSSFVQASRILSSIVPDNDMTEENFQVGAKKWQSVVELIGTAGGAAASITAAFVGPYAPIPLLVGGIVKGITSAINVIISQRIKASEARQYLDKFIAIFEKASSALQGARNKVSNHRENLQTWLASILNAIKNINENKESLELV